ncbi:MAG: AtpZ/AtpI family protein [Proteobacteria bacterium]|nr:AtpZ/AtpI family protein [Pseudomonadota bacterium]
MPDQGKPGQPPRGELPPEERAALEQRSNELGRKLEEARHVGQKGGPRPSSGGGGDAMGSAMRLSAELVGGVVAGGAIGWFLDSWLHTKPWLFILMFLLGAAAGMRNLIRTSMQQKTPPLPSVPDEQDDDK